MSEKEHLVQEIMANMVTGRRLMIACMQRFKGSITISQTEALVVIYHDGPITQKKLAAQMQLTPGSITQLVEQLERLGFVKRSASTSDRRVTHVAITETGTAEVMRIKARKEDLFKNVYQDMTIEEVRTMARVQEKMIAYLKERAGEQPKE